ncbi:MAG: DUF4340 domain-containing protein [Gammaproteobacteria bacterium]|nr:DUF4340 domain-containing protein [Gammaproteobacteria bacterium]
MSSRSLLNLALILVAVSLGLVVFYKPGLEPEPAPQSVTALNPETVTSIHVSRTIREPLSFTRDGDSWMLAGDPELPASEFQIPSLLSILQAATTRSYPAASLDLEAVGLQPPQAVLTLDDTVFSIGLTTALDNKRYIQLEDTVYLVDDKYQHLLNGGRTNFIGRKLLPANSSLTRLQLPDKTLSLNEEGQWQLTPADPAVSSADIQALIKNWENGRATYVKNYDGAAATATITLETSDSSGPVTLHLIRKSPDFVLARPDWGIQYHLQGQLGNALLGIQDPAPDKNPAAED